MSVASRNAFALLGEDNDGGAPAPAAAPAAPAKKEVAPALSGGAQRGARGRGAGPASRGGRYYARGGAGGPKPPREGGAEDEAAPTGDNAGRRKFDGEGRGRGGGRGGARGRGESRGRGRGGARLDRHSQTGKTDSDKKIHQGWGGDEPTTELNAEQGGAADAANDWTAPPAADWAGDAAPTEPAAEGAAPATEGAEAKPERRPRVDEEEEDNTLTLEQYLAKKKEEESNALPAKLEARQVDSKIEGQVIKKGAEEDEAYFAGKAKSAPKARSKKEEKVFIEIDGHFERPQRGGGRGGRGGDRGDRGGGRGGDRGGRGGDRGGRGRGGFEGRGRGRGARQNGSAPGANLKIDDESAFPSLS